MIDVETTGFSRNDRIVEFACVTVSNGAVIDEYDTLLQPDRDPGPTHIHGITPSMLESAPSFESVAADIAARLDGAVIAAHNLSFDLRMLAQEVDRVGGMELQSGAGLCTYRLSGVKLAVAAAQQGLQSPDHSALTDARVAAHLVNLYRSSSPLPRVASASCSAPGSSGCLTVRRQGAPQRRGALAVLAARTDWPPTTQESESWYLDALDRCLDDAELSDQEHRWLTDTAKALGLSSEDRESLHQEYFDRLVEQILADGIVSERESQLHAQVAAALGIKTPPLRRSETGPASGFSAADLEDGVKVCFTGSAVIDGRSWARPELERLARGLGLEVTGSVTKQCGLVIAADRASRSGKARRARQLGIKIISVKDFIEATSNQATSTRQREGDR